MSINFKSVPSGALRAAAAQKKEREREIRRPQRLSLLLPLPVRFLQRAFSSQGYSALARLIAFAHARVFYSPARASIFILFFPTPHPTALIPRLSFPKPFSSYTFCFVPRREMFNCSGPVSKSLRRWKERRHYCPGDYYPFGNFDLSRPLKKGWEDAEVFRGYG